MGIHSAMKAALLRPLRRLNRALHRRLRLQRKGLSLHVVLDPVAAPSRKAGSGHRAKDQPQSQMLRELGQVLNHHPHTRRLFPALALTERALAKGSESLEHLPKPVVAQALQQLEQLVGDWDGAGLAQLRSRLAALAPVRAAKPTVEVLEASMSVFMEADASWQRQTKTLPVLSQAIAAPAA